MTAHPCICVALCKVLMHGQNPGQPTKLFMTPYIHIHVPCKPDIIGPRFWRSANNQ